MKRREFCTLYKHTEKHKEKVISFLCFTKLSKRNSEKYTNVKKESILVWKSQP